MFKRPSCGSASERIPRSKRLQLMLEAQKLGIVLSESALDAAIRSTISSTSSTTIGQPAANAEYEEVGTYDMNKDNNVKLKKATSLKTEVVAAKNRLSETKSKLMKEEAVHSHGHPSSEQPRCTEKCEPKVSKKCHGKRCSLETGHDSQHMCWACRRWTMTNPLESSLKECVQQDKKREVGQHIQEGEH